MIKSFLLLAGLAASATATNWALLMAGSNTFQNYRHQADIYHSYQVLKQHNIKDENIIVMHYDDIAKDKKSRGEVINQPGGPNVYAGVPKDYTGKDVNAKNFLAALAGDASKTSCKVKSSTCRVLNSTADDNVFVYFADHGGAGILGVPAPIPFLHPYIHAKDVINSLNELHSKKMYKQLTFYIEACESGSIFDGLLPTDINVYGVTAANPSESSWGMYCPGQGGKFEPPIATCLGDLFSVNFLQDMDRLVGAETLSQQYALVMNETSPATETAGHPGISGSHVQQYGDLSWGGETVDTFIGTPSQSPLTAAAPAGTGGAQRGTMVNSRDAELESYFATWRLSGAPEDLAALQSHIAWRQRVDEIADALVERLAGAAGAEKIRTRRAVPVVQDSACHMGMINEFESRCVTLNGYGFRHARALANLCDAGFTPKDAAEVFAKIC